MDLKRKIDALVKEELENNIGKYIEENKEEIVNLILDSFWKNYFKKDVINVKKLPKKEEKENIYTDIFGNKCSSLTKDHIYPKNKGGINKKENIMYICEASNKAKGNNLEGEINQIKFKISRNKPKGTLKGDGVNQWKGILTIKKPNDKKYQNVKTSDEALRYEKWVEKKK